MSDLIIPQAVAIFTGEEETMTDRQIRRLPLHLQFSGLSLISHNPPRDTCPVQRKRRRPLPSEMETLIGERNPLYCFRSLHGAGVPSSVLMSLADLVSRSSLENDPDCDDVREANVDTLALYLVSTNTTSFQGKLGTLRILLAQCMQPHLNEFTLRDCLHFITNRSSLECPLPDNMLLWELRAKCLHIIDLKRLVVPTRSETAVHCIAGAAKSVARGLALSVPIISVGLERTGELVKERLVPQAPMTPRSKVVTLTYTSAAKRASDGIRKTARWTVHGVRNASTKGIHLAANRFEEKKWGERCVPNRKCRDVVVAAGTVGLAGIGAAAIVGEAIFDCTREVALKAGEVTADVVGYKYGEAAGQAVQDATETTANLIQTAHHLLFLEKSKVFARGVAKNSMLGIEQDHSDPVVETQPKLLLFLDPTKMAAIKAVRNLKQANEYAVRNEQLYQSEEQPHISMDILGDGMEEATEMSFQYGIVPLVFILF